MPICEKCQNTYPIWITINGKPRNLKSRRYCLDCSPFGNHNTRRLAASVPNRHLPCVVCERPRKRDKGRRCPTCETLVRRFLAKRRAVDILGGKCYRCGYNENLAALQFHHIDPAAKAFGVNKILHKSWAFVETELQKCILLCANCHAVEHTNRPPAFFAELSRYSGKHR